MKEKGECNMLKNFDRLVEIINIHHNHRNLTYEQVKDYIAKALEDLVSTDEAAAKVLEYRIDDKLSYTEIQDLLDLETYELTARLYNRAIGIVRNSALKQIRIDSGLHYFIDYVENHKRVQSLTKLKLKTFEDLEEYMTHGGQLSPTMTKQGIEYLASQLPDKFEHLESSLLAMTEKEDRLTNVVKGVEDFIEDYNFEIKDVKTAKRKNSFSKTYIVEDAVTSNSVSLSIQLFESGFALVRSKTSRLFAGQRIEMVQEIECEISSLRQMTQELVLSMFIYLDQSND